MIQTVLVDDEKDNVRILQRLLEAYCPDVHVVGTAEGVDTAEQLIRDTNPDLVLLDIELIQGNAFDLLERLTPLKFQVIFVTAFDAYAIKAFKYSAVDYLLKPVDVDELRNAINKVAQRMGAKMDVSAIKVLLENVGALHLAQQKMAVPTLTGLSFVTVSDIIRFEAMGHYTSIHLSSGEPLMATRNIKEYEDILPAAIFCRVHNSHIINLQKITKYQKGRGGYVIMEDGSSIEVATRRRQEFLQRLLK
jgi:two-component system, LytTR family, response regulator